MADGHRVWKDPDIGAVRALLAQFSSVEQPGQDRGVAEVPLREAEARVLEQRHEALAVQGRVVARLGDAIEAHELPPQGQETRAQVWPAEPRPTGTEAVHSTDLPPPPPTVNPQTA